MKSRKHKLAYQILFYLWLTAILVLVYYPRLPTAKIEFGEDRVFRLDYIGHLGFYAVLMILFLLWRSDDRYRITGKKLILASLLGLAFAAFTEISQEFFMHARVFNPLDLVCNLLGIVAGFLAFRLIIMRRWERTERTERL